LAYSRLEGLVVGQKKMIAPIIKNKT
jgi:hypothetical protein